MKRDVYGELRKIWDGIPKLESNKELFIDFSVHKKLLDIFQVGEYFYLVVNVRKSFFEMISPELQHVLGHDPEAFDVPYFLDIVHPDDLPVMLNFESALEGFFKTIEYSKLFKYKTQYDIRLRKANGKYSRYLNQMLILDHTPEDIRTFVVFTDISHLKQETKPSLSFIGMEGEPSYYNVDTENLFRPVRQVLTRREREIIKALANGMSSIEIGDTLNISRFTVDSHRKNMLKKASAKSTNELIKIAFDKGWV